MSELPKAEKLARAWDKVMSGGRSFDSGLIAQTKKELRSLQAALAAKDAETSAAVAAALGAAAARIKLHLSEQFMNPLDRSRGWRDGPVGVVLSFITPDATDALERDRARVRREALEEAAESVAQVYRGCTYVQPHAHTANLKGVAAIRALGDKP